MIVGITGRKRHGKDAVAAWFTEAKGFQQMAFADEMRSALLDLNPLIACGTVGHGFTLQEAVETRGWEDAKSIPEVRRLLQTFGAEVVRTRDPDFWVRIIEEFYSSHRPLDVVVSDVRYDNEAEMIRRHGGRVIKVVRPGQDDSDTHSSESGISLALVDTVVVNDGTVGDLHDAVRDYWESRTHFEPVDRSSLRPENHWTQGPGVARWMRTL